MLTNGLGVPQNDVAAAKWYQKAAEQGFKEAQHTLGLMYANGQGVERDQRQADFWHRQATSQ